MLPWMDDCLAALKEIAAAGPARLVFSAPRPQSGLRRASLTRLREGWQLEKLTATQAFHQWVKAEDLAGVAARLLEEDFTQLTAFTHSREYGLKISKKGRVLTNSRPLAAKAAEEPFAGQDPAVPHPDLGATRAGGLCTGHAAEAVDVAGEKVGRRTAGHPTQAGAPPHDQAKSRLLAEGVAIPALVDIGVMTAEGRVVAAKRDKWRQVNRFLELVEDVLRRDRPQRLRVVDFGCGKSSLTFALYHYLTVLRGIEAEVTGLDLKADVVAGCNAAAQKYGYGGLKFLVGDIADYRPGDAPAGAGPEGAVVDMVITLHACDTATDLALAKAVGWGARYILSVPCCQHQLNGQMQGGQLPILTRYGIVQERTAALMTDAIRANLLCACGYKAQLLEFVDLEHTPKNIMIRARRSGMPRAVRQQALAEVRQLCGAFGFKPALEGLLGDRLEDL